MYKNEEKVLLKMNKNKEKREKILTYCKIRVKIIAKREKTKNIKILQM